MSTYIQWKNWNYHFDVVVCNLYPFEENNTIENIDIGGVSLIRASGKNYNNIILLSNP